MKRKKIILIVCSCICLILSGVVMAIVFSYDPPKHQHVLGEDKTYHILNNSVYYTRECADGCKVRFDTKMSFADTLATVAENDKIVLEGDIKLTKEMYIKTFAGTGDNVQELEMNINLDLNNYTISTNVDSSNKEYDSVFMINANRGKVNFNIKNGKIFTEDLSYIFRLKNNQYYNDNIILNIENVECETKGVKTTPIFGSEFYNVEINANNSKFISTTTGTQNSEYGVGAFINSNSEFNFTNCYFEGGDAVYVKSGNVNLTNCKLVNSGLVNSECQNTDTFSAVGACLTANCYATSSGVSQFAVTIINCRMESKSSYKMIYVIETAAESGLALGVNSNSIIDVQSCMFNNNPTAQTIPQYDLVKYPNNEAPSNNGTQVWICGDVDPLTME